MTTLAVTFADAETACKDYLKAELAARAESATVGVGLPGTWTTSSPTHVSVEMDGTPLLTYPVVARATVRVTAWASSRTEAKRVVGLCMGLLLAHPGSDDLWSITPLTGVLPARDPDNGAPIASVTVRASVRPTVVT